ncbi:MAG: hypothetical protein VX619_08870, partial [bacterium]|nr:hypothetical protein [bacterium]
TTAQILTDSDLFGPNNSWSENSITGDLQSVINDHNNLSGIVNKTQLTTYSVQANLYSTGFDDDMVALIAAASIDQNNQLHLILAARSGLGTANIASNITTNWGLLYVTIDQNSPTNLPANGSNQPELLSSATWTSLEGVWTNFPTGTTVRVEKTANGVSAYASPFHPSTLQAVDTNSVVHIDWSTDVRLNTFRGPTSFGFAAYSQEGASYRDIIINGIESCSITP